MICWPRGAAAAMGAIALVAWTGRAWGDGSADAEELFKQGRAALEAQDYPLAYAKLAASLQAEPAVGTLISLAECEEARHRLVAARRRWQEAADLAEARHDHRGVFAREKLAAVDVRVPRLLVHSASSAAKDTLIRRDETDLGPADIDVETLVDPGAHVVSVTARGREERRYPIDLAEGEHKVLEVEPGAELVAPSPTAAPSQERPPSGAVPVPVAAHDGAGQKIAALAVGGLGVAGIAAGAGFGLNAFSEWATAKKECGDACPAGSQAHAAADTDKSRASTSATVSTVAFAAGGIAIVAGAISWFTAPAPHRTGSASGWLWAAQIEPRGAAFTLNGAW
jgi:hypothetical protein